MGDKKVIDELMKSINKVNNKGDLNMTKKII